MGPRSKNAPRCPRCRIHYERCLCGELPTFELETRVVLVMHQRETVKTTATGPLALAALPNSELLVHGTRDERLDLNRLFEEGRRVLLLYPSEDARPIEELVRDDDMRPVTLVVPDGNWRQAARAARRLPGLERAERVTLSLGPPTEWGIRNEPKEGGLATFEAIARALGALESSEVQGSLEALFRRMVDDTWVSRGVWRPTDAPAIPEGEEPLEVLYQDADLVAVHKPSGLLVHRGWASDARPVLQRLRDQLRERVYPVHRLDRATSGVLLFAKRAEMASLVGKMFRERSVEKKYLALCRGKDPGLKRVDHPLADTLEGEKKEAVTEFRLLGSWERYGLYEARPLTGRVHQIRRHLKYASHPLVGDVRYGKGEHNRLFRERFGFERLALHCHSLAFVHPKSGERLEIHAPLAEDFRRLVEQLELTERLPPEAMSNGRVAGATVEEGASVSRGNVSTSP